MYVAVTNYIVVDTANNLILKTMLTNNQIVTCTRRVARFYTCYYYVRHDRATLTSYMNMLYKNSSSVGWQSVRYPHELECILAPVPNVAFHRKFPGACAQKSTVAYEASNTAIWAPGAAPLCWTRVSNTSSPRQLSDSAPYPSHS